MIENIKKTCRDSEELEKILVDQEMIKDDFFDYSKVVVRKPWGYEYLIFQNDFVAIWVLFIKDGAQTSMHCHLNKKTSLIVLEGSVTSSTLKKDFDLDFGEGLLLDRGVFHQTTATCKSGSFVMEIETPVNKRDLVRLKDKYGREGKGYETSDQYSINTQNYNHISFSASQIQHNFKKRFGSCSLTFKKVTSENDLKEILKLESDDVISVLSGQLLDEAGLPVVQMGDTFAVSVLQDGRNFSVDGNAEFLIIKRIDRIIKISDYIASFLSAQGLETVFVVAGEANVHLLDSIGRKEGLRHIPLKKESSASLACEAFGKLRASPSTLVISSGSSTVGVLPGVANAWIDSVPLLILSGQARTDQDFDGCVRQLGNKSLDIIELVKSITKYAVKVTEPSKIRFHLEKAIHLANEGRPGPVWVDIPIDVQGATIDEEELVYFLPKKSESACVENADDLVGSIENVVNLLSKSKRPVILAGSGIHNARAEDSLLKLLDSIHVPVLTSRRGADLVPYNYKNFFGNPGTYGQRSANFVVQNCDLLISIGSRLSIPLIGRNTSAFARGAMKVVVDIDPLETKKTTVKADVPIAVDAGVFIQEFMKRLPSDLPKYTNWLERCREWRIKFPPDSYTGPSLPFKEPENDGLIHPLPFVRALSNEMYESDVLVTDGGPPLIYTLHAFRFKPGQRLVNSTGLELPGFALSGSIGASFACERKRVVCLCEDRGFQVSIHELQTIIDYNLPIKIIILKSHGHSIIRNIQKDYFGGRFVGTDNEIRLGTASLMKVAAAYGLRTMKLSDPELTQATLKKVLNEKGPTVCEIEIENDQDKLPRPGFTIQDGKKWVAKSLEDMYPLLDYDVLKNNMIIDLVEED